MPAAKYRVLVGPESVLPAPKKIAQRPRFVIVLPVESFRKPLKAPVVGSYAPIQPLAVLPTSSMLLKKPKFDGALAMPHGSSNHPRCRRNSSLPEGLKASTKPR